jgi:hypothetical protein
MPKFKLVLNGEREEVREYSLRVMMVWNTMKINRLSLMTPINQKEGTAQEDLRVVAIQGYALRE